MNRSTGTNWELDEVLEQSLSQIVAGTAGVEACLASNPGMAGELEPMLLAAQRLWAIPKPVLSPGAKARIEAQMLAMAAARRPRLRVALPRWGWALGAIAAVLICIILTMSTLVTASAQALPGSGLYPVKLAAEDAWLRLAPERREPSLHLRFAQRRLAEVEKLAERGRFEPSILEAMVAEVEAALTETEKLPPDQALPLLTEAQAQIGDEQQALSGLQAELPPAAQPDLARTLGAMVALAERVGEIRRLVSPLEPAVSPSPVSTPTLTSTPVASGTITATATLVPTPTYTPSASPTAMPAALPTATGAPAGETRPVPRALPTTPTPPPPPTNTPSPTPTTRVPPGQTKTPQPPGQTKTPKPAHVRPANNSRPTRTPSACNPADLDGLTLIPGQGGAAGKAAFTAWMWVSPGPKVLAHEAKSNQTLTALQRDFNKVSV